MKINIIYYIFYIILITIYIFYIINKRRPIYKISLFILFKNNEDYLNYFILMMKNIESNYNYDIYYYIYENNSTDNTKNLLKEFMKFRKGNLIAEDINNKYTDEKLNSGISLDRGIKMSTIRNKNKNSAGINNTDYSIIIDSDVFFKEDIIDKMIKSINKNKNIGMVTTFNVDYENYCETENFHYYDSFAFINKNNISYKDTSNKCLFRQCKRCINFRYNNNIKIKDSDLFDMSSIVYVKSAFGGFALLKTALFNSIYWGETICEHFYFCKMIRNLNYKIILDTNIKTVTKYDKKYDINIINKILS